MPILSGVFKEINKFDLFGTIVWKRDQANGPVNTVGDEEMGFRTVLRVRRTGLRSKDVSKRIDRCDDLCE